MSMYGSFPSLFGGSNLGPSPTDDGGSGPVLDDLEVSPLSVDFGNVELNDSSAAFAVNLTHTGHVGTEPITITELSIIGLDSTEFNHNALVPIVLEFGESIDIYMTFNPIVEVFGLKNAILRIVHNAANSSPIDVSLTGTSSAPDAVLGIAPSSSTDFGSVELNEVSAIQVFTLTNAGDVGADDIIISAIAFTGADDGEFTHNAVTPITIPQGESREIEVRFAPVDDLSFGAKTATLSITHDATNTSPVEIDVSGTSTQPLATLSHITPASFDFPDTPLFDLSTPNTFTLSNTGADGAPDITISAISFTGTHAVNFDHDATLPQVLSPGETYDFDVWFNPTVWYDGVNSATLEAVHDGSNESPRTSAMTGTIEALTYSLLEERFLTPITPLGTSRTSEPGGQVAVTVTDTGSKAYIDSSNRYRSNDDNNATGDPRLVYPSHARTAGNANYVHFMQTGNTGSFGVTDTATPTAQAQIGFARASGVHVPHVSGQPYRHIHCNASVEEHIVCIEHAAGGTLFRYEGGGVWKLELTSAIGTHANFYPAVWTVNLGTYDPYVYEMLSVNIPDFAGTRPFSTINSTPTSGVTIDSGFANGHYELLFTMPGSPANGDSMELVYRRQDASNYFRIRVIREAGVWNFYHHAVVAGVETTLLDGGAASAGNVGTLNRLVAIVDSTTHHSFTHLTSASPICRTPSATTSADGGTVNTNFSSAEDIVVTWSGSFTAVSVVATPARSTVTSQYLNQFLAEYNPPPPPEEFEKNFIYFYKPEINNNHQLVVENYQRFILTHRDEAAREIMKGLGVTVPFQQYIRFDGVHDPCNVSNGGGDCGLAHFGNNVNTQVGETYDMIQANPGWFLHDASDGGIHRSGDGYAYTDPGEAGWRAYWLARAVDLYEDNGWDGGIFLDNVPGTLNHVGQAVQEYNDDAVYRVAVRGFLQHIYENKPVDCPLYANLIYVPSGSTGTTIWDDYLDYLDGAMEEAAFVPWPTTIGWLSLSDWNTQMTRFEAAIAREKLVIAISQGAQTPNPAGRQEFAFASYLLLAGPYITWRYTNYNNYRYVWLYDNYETFIGQPTSARYSVDSGAAWQRDFENGFVKVNPSTHAVTLSFS